VTARSDAAQWARNVRFAAVAACLLVAAYLFHAFYLVTQGGLNEVRRHLDAMADGDLTTHPNPWGKDEAATLMLSLHDMQAALRNIVLRVRASSGSIVDASSEIAAASMDLSGRTEQAAANLEESAASIEQISATVNHTAESVRQAAQLASGNAQTAVRGGTVVGQVVDTMRDINVSSKKIGDIIGTIDGIAFQTNILALNAAVEAARAGDQGRGFAVVASEVRSLAQRSALAAREIKTLIGASVENMEVGTQVVKGAGDTMQELVSNASRMHDLLAGIATASAQQSSGVTQVGAAVNELDRMTQQNAALVEQTAAAAAALEAQALGLATEVARFRLPAGC
jgi:methyl-accepting chemotaxis protein